MYTFPGNMSPGIGARCQDRVRGQVRAANEQKGENEPSPQPKGVMKKHFFTGLKKFVEHCNPLVNSFGNVKCLCKSCRNVSWVSIPDLSRHITNNGWDPSYETWTNHGEPNVLPPVIHNTTQPQMMSDKTTCLNDLSYIPPNNEQNEPTQGDIGETSNEPTQAIRNEFEELYASANEELYPEPRNVRLGLAAIGFNPFGNLTQSNSMWPVILTTYNLPSWLCIKESSFILMLLIPGPISSSKDVDVYLRPLIGDLKELWAKPGVETIDVATCQKFNMRAMVVWAINDFTARSSESGWSGQDVMHIEKKVLESILNTLLMNEKSKDTTKIRQRHIDKDPGVSASSDLFTLACGPTPTSISVNSCVVNGVRFVMHSRDECRTTQNNGICSPGEDGEMYYVKEYFYLEDMARRPLGWKVVEHVNHKMFSNGGVIVIEEDPDIIHVNNSYDLALTTRLNDLEITALHIDGQSIDVDAPSDIIDVDEDDDIIDYEDVLPHDLEDSNDEDLVNVDDDDGVISADVARVHDSDGGGDYRPPPHQLAGSCRGGEFFQNVFPISKGYKLPSSYYTIKKTFKMIGLGYESIQACKHDCCLFREVDNKDLDFCPMCNMSRWKDSNTPGKKVQMSADVARSHGGDNRGEDHPLHTMYPVVACVALLTERKRVCRKTVPLENSTENALIAKDRIGGYDWSYQAEEEHPTNFALMALTSSRSSSNLDSELLEAIEKRYGGNKESKKVQRILLKQKYENFAASSSETLDQTFDRLEKLISQLEIQGSLSTSQNPQNVAFVSSNSTNSTSSTNEIDNTAYEVSIAHTHGKTVNSTSVDNLSDVVICAFLASQPNSPQLAREDLKQFDPDELEEMDLH
uniref:Transposase-associated domain-containing protein n=1 Tax=Tanacetum cinerariifolium TaxID=118510 RepID=A0A6L2NYX7_TANCI|nr:hypothetical protein [Tanacetum cinerariifolium]